MELIKTEKLKFTYPKSNQSFSFPDIELTKGENLLLAGKSGSGKTTLLHLLAGILTPGSGTVIIDQIPTTTFSSYEMDAFRGKKMGLIFQENYFIESLSVYNNLFYISALCGLKPEKAYIQNLLCEMDIEKLSDKKPTQLSRGELQRFSIARALVNKPALLLADEPTSSIDDENCERFIHLVKEICQTHALSLIVATHDGRLKNEFTNCVML